MNCYFVRIMYGRSCTKVPYFVLIIQLVWVPQAVLVCNWPIKKRFSLVKLKSSLRKFYSRHHDLVDHYAICVTNDHFLVLYSFMTYHWVCNQINITGATSGAGTAYQFLVGFVLLGLQFYLLCMFCRSLFALLYFFFWILCCLVFFFRYTDSDYLFGIFKLILAKFGRKHLWKVLYTGSQNKMTGEQYRLSPPSLQCFLVFNDFQAIHFFLH